MTTMNTEPSEREEAAERLKRIRERRVRYAKFISEPPTWGDIDFLLSLLDSQAVSDNVKWDANYWMLNVFTNTEFTFAQKVEALVKYHNDAATRMRERCVDRVKELRDGWRERTGNSDDPTFKLHYQTRFDAAEEIRDALESLTLDGEKEQ